MFKMVMIVVVAGAFLQSCKSKGSEKDVKKSIADKKEVSLQIGALLKELKSDLELKEKVFESPKVTGKMLMEFFKGYKGKQHFINRKTKTVFTEDHKVSKGVLTVSIQYYKVGKGGNTLNKIMFAETRVDIDTKTIISTENINQKLKASAKMGPTVKCILEGKLFNCFTIDENGKITKGKSFEKSLDYGCYDCETYFFIKIKEGEYNCKAKCFNSLSQKFDDNKIRIKSHSNNNIVGVMQKGDSNFFIFAILELSKTVHFETLLKYKNKIRTSVYKPMTNQEMKKYKIID